MPSARRRPAVVRHRPVTILASAVTFALAFCLLRARAVAGPTVLPASIHQCRLLSVTATDHCAPPAASRDPSQPCFWTVLAATQRHTAPHRLHTAAGRPLQTSELSILRQTVTCRTAVECNATVPCTIPPGDPSDAFWINTYNADSKFVVLFNISFATLIFFISAIIADGSLFHPHRPGFAVISASVLILFAFAALIYVMLIPHAMQFALWGRGPLQSFAYVCTVVFIAALLPAVAVTWISIVVFLAFLIGFLFEHIIYIIFATVHFLASLTAYQLSNTILHLRLVYFRDFDDEEEFDNRLLRLSTVFMRRVRNNWFLTRIPRTMGQTAVQLMQNNLPDAVFDQMDQGSVPQIDFDALDHPDSVPSTDRSRQPSEDLPGPVAPAMDTTPLLRSNPAP